VPKGKAGISGAVFIRSYPVIADDQKSELLDQLSAFREKAGRGALTGDLREQVWQQILRLGANYRGQLKAGLPITEAQRTKRIDKIKKQARVLARHLEALPSGRWDRLFRHINKLIKMIVDADLHTMDKLGKAMNREANNLMGISPARIRNRLGVLQTELAMHRKLSRFAEEVEDLGELTEQLKRVSAVNTSLVSYPKGEPNPYLAYFVRYLVCVWDEVVGEMPARTWVPYSDAIDKKGVETFPFLTWANELLSALDAHQGGVISSRLARHELDLEKEQRRLGRPPSSLPT